MRLGGGQEGAAADPTGDRQHPWHRRRRIHGERLTVRGADRKAGPGAVQVEKLNPTVQVVHYNMITFDHGGAGRTAVRFVVAADGKVTDVSRTRSPWHAHCVICATCNPPPNRPTMTRQAEILGLSAVYALLSTPVLLGPGDCVAREGRTPSQSDRWRHRQPIDQNHAERRSSWLRRRQEDHGAQAAHRHRHGRSSRRTDHAIASIQDRDGAVALLASTQDFIPSCLTSLLMAATLATNCVTYCSIWPGGQYRSLNGPAQHRASNRPKTLGRTTQGPHALACGTAVEGVERTFAWLGRCRRLAKGHETNLTSSTTSTLIAMSGDLRALWQGHDIKSSILVAHPMNWKETAGPSTHLPVDPARRGTHADRSGSAGEALLQALAGWIEESLPARRRCLMQVIRTVHCHKKHLHFAAPARPLGPRWQSRAS